MPPDKAQLSKTIMARWDAMKSDRALWDPLWDEIARYVLPRKAAAPTQPGMEASEVLFDTTAVQACQTLANGMLSYVTPADGRWFVFAPPVGKEGNDKVVLWLQECTERVQAFLATSNFYSEIHELFFDDGGFGTTVLLALESKTKLINFQSLAIQSFCLSEDDENEVDTCFRELKLTPRQAAMRWGENSLSEALRKELENWRKNGGKEEKHCFIHAMYPRPDEERDLTKQDGPNMPYASVYLEQKSKHIVSISGFNEKPFFATRHLKMTDEVYGYCPSFAAVPDARQLNFLTQQLDALAETKAFPRFKLPYDYEGEIDIGAGGKTYFDPTKGNGPEEWLTSGDYSIGVDRENRKQQAIDRAFYVDLFKMFASLDKQMTAREVAERSAEKLIQFTPAFARKTTELLRPLLQRIFSIHSKRGLFSPPPLEILERDSAGNWFLPIPNISYNSKAAIAIKAFYNLSFGRTLEGIAPLLQAQRFEVLDNFDLDRISRDMATNDGLPSDWMVPEDKRDEMRQARAEAQIQAQEAAQAQMLAETAAKVKNDSPAAQLLTGNR